MGNFILGVLASAVAAVLLAAIPAVRSGCFRFWVVWRQAKFLSTMYRTGIESMRTRRDEVNVLTLLKSVKRELVYIGVVPDAESLTEWQEGFEDLLSSGKKVALVFWGTDVDEKVMGDVALYYTLTCDTMRAKLDAAWDTASRFRDGLPETCRRNFELRKHNLVLTDSVFLIDVGWSSNAHPAFGRIHLDQKLYGLGKRESVILALRWVPNDGSLYQRILNSFALVWQKSETC